MLPTALAPSGGPATVQLLVLGAFLPVTALVLDSAWALGAGTAREWFTTSPHRLQRVGRVGGSLMVGSGVHLALVQRPG